MHVVIVNQYALPSGSAGITRHGDLGRELAARGHTVTVIASRFNYLSRTLGSSPPAEEIEGVTFRWLDTGAYEGNDAGRLRSMVEYLCRATVAGISLGRKPDVVIGSSPQLLAGLSALAIAKRFRVPFVFEVRDPWPSALVDLGAIRPGGLTHRLLRLIERLLYRTATRVITVMAHADRRVAEVGENPRKCVFIPNASRIPPHIGAISPDIAERLGAERTAGRITITYAGAHGLSNGLDEVFDALSLVRERDPMAYEGLAFVFIGDGPSKAALTARGSREQYDRVYFFPPVEKAEALAAMELSDFVLIHFAEAPFKGYGMSANKLFDAMAVGRPVLLATPLRDTPVDTVECGIRYDPGSLDALADALQHAGHMSAADRQAMGQRGFLEASRKYNLEVTGRQLEDLLTKITTHAAGYR